jgi:hypothetical protein
MVQRRRRPRCLRFLRPRIHSQQTRIIGDRRRVFGTRASVGGGGNRRVGFTGGEQEKLLQLKASRLCSLLLAVWLRFDTATGPAHFAAVHSLHWLPGRWRARAARTMQFLFVKHRLKHRSPFYHFNQIIGLIYFKFSNS